MLAACVPLNAEITSDPPQSEEANIPTALIVGATATVFPSAVSTSAPTPLACWTEGGRIERGSIESELLPQELEFRVYLPPCYDALTEQSFSVLYLIHGQSFNDDQWDRLGADETADALIATGELAPFIMVMPRDRVWTSPDQDHFGEAVAADLIPFIDENYRTLADREHRAIGGLSRGAAWAVHIGLGNWELFGAIGAHSLPLFWEDVSDVPRWLDEIPPEQMPRFFLDVATHDYETIRSSAQWFEGQLEERDIPHEWYMFEGRHEEAYWQAHLELYLRFYAGEW